MHVFTPKFEMSEKNILVISLKKDVERIKSEGYHLTNFFACIVHGSYYPISENHGRRDI